MAGQKHYDSFSALALGVNSGVEPLLLPPTQASWGTNATFRGGFISHRSRFQKQVLGFGGSQALQTAVEKGYFQGAWWYRPDFGLTQIVASISGRLFAFVNPGAAWTVTEISIPGDLNDPTIPRVWMWQSEKWLIISDGSGKLPIFYDGVSSRRSYGPSVVLGTVNAVVTPASPALAGIGGTVQVTMAAAYSGPFNVPVIFNGAFYQTLAASPTANNAILDTIYTHPLGDTVAVGDQVLAIPSQVGVVISSTLVATSPFVTIEVVTVVGSNTVTVGEYVNLASSFGTVTCQVVQIVSTGTTSTYRLRVWWPPVIPAGAVVDWILSRVGSTAPNVIIGTVATGFTVAAGSNGINLNTPYTGVAGQSVWINNRIYTMAPVPTGSSTTLYLINLSDTATANYGTAPHTLPESLLSVPELPAGRMGAYGMGRNWMCLTDGISFIAGDIVGGAAGTVAYNYRDAVLKTTENTFLAAGGTFRLPGSGNIINSMTFTANLDQSLGQGPLQIGTDSSIFSCDTPTVRADWVKLTNPILTESLIGFGPLAQYSTVLANSDTLFRQIEGLGSLILARRDFNEWGNTPISREVGRILDKDEKTLLPFGSAVVFDNRFLVTCAPTSGAQGVYHAGLVALNFDLISNLRGKAPPIYDGLWTGLNCLQLVTGNFSGTGRAFAFGYNLDDSKIELYEIVPTLVGGYDNGVTPIQWNLESPPIFRPDQRGKNELLVRLLQGQIHLRDVVGLVKIKVLYRPDFWPCWIEWNHFEICADTTVANGQPGYRTPVGLGEPSAKGCEAANNRPYRVGRFFQIRVEIEGSCKIMGMEFEAMSEPITPFVPPLCCPVDSETIPLPT